jgi:uncharacterized membrane protein
MTLLAGLLAQGQPPTIEMLARGNPTVLDALVAFASGIMGAYATARKEIPSALAGVAIAAALMPPLCAFGLELAVGRLDSSLRAGLLFLTNIVCKSMAAWIVFFWLGMRPMLTNTSKRLSYGSVVAFALFVLLTIGLLLNVSSVTNRTQNVTTWLSEAFSPGEVSDVQFRDGPVIRAVVSSTAPVTVERVMKAEAALKVRLSENVKLEINYRPLIVSP